MIRKEPHFTDSQLVKMMDDYDRQCEEYFKHFFKNKSIMDHISFIEFFCLAAKMRQAQKKYYAAKKDDPDKQNLLITSKKLETLLDAEIKKNIGDQFWTDEQLKKAWENFIGGELNI